MDIQGYDISHDAIAAAMENARLAEVDHLIHFQQRPVQELSHRKIRLHHHQSTLRTAFGFRIGNARFVPRDRRSL